MTDPEFLSILHEVGVRRRLREQVSEALVEAFDFYDPMTVKVWVKVDSVFNLVSNRMGWNRSVEDCRFITKVLDGMGVPMVNHGGWHLFRGLCPKGERVVDFQSPFNPHGR